MTSERAATVRPFVFELQTVREMGERESKRECTAELRRVSNDAADATCWPGPNGRLKKCYTLTQSHRRKKVFGCAGCVFLLLLDSGLFALPVKSPKAKKKKKQRQNNKVKNI